MPIEPDDVSANTDKVSMPDTYTGVSTTSSTLPRDQDRYPVTATKPEPPVHTSAHTYDSFVLFGGLGGVLLLVLVLFGILLRRTGNLVTKISQSRFSFCCDSARDLIPECSH